jgi:hypothetical protein
MQVSAPQSLGFQLPIQEKCAIIGPERLWCRRALPDPLVAPLPRRELIRGTISEDSHHRRSGRHWLPSGRFPRGPGPPRTGCGQPLDWENGQGRAPTGRRLVALFRRHHSGRVVDGRCRRWRGPGLPFSRVRRREAHHRRPCGLRPHQCRWDQRGPGKTYRARKANRHPFQF